LGWKFRQALQGRETFMFQTVFVGKAAALRRLAVDGISRFSVLTRQNRLGEKNAKNAWFWRFY